MSDATADASQQDASYRVGVDIGGTFTDLILVETASGAITVGKSLTTPVDPSEAIETVSREETRKRRRACSKPSCAATLRAGLS